MLSGVSTRSIEPPKFGAEQDYVVVGAAAMVRWDCFRTRNCSTGK